MAATGAKIGKKTQFLRETTPGGGVYAAVAEVKTINGLKMSRAAVDATNNDSPNDFEEFIAGLGTAGEIDLLLNFRPEHASQGATAGLLADFLAGTVRGWQIAWPQFTSTPTATCNGFLIGHEVVSTHKDLVTVSVKVKLTGEPVLTNFA